jgi:hypothetical protein
MGPKNPRTPENTGIQESLILNSDYSYVHTMYGYTIEDLPVARGTFSIGHGSYTPYRGAYTYTYDSIVYYPNSVFSQRFVDYFKVSNDTMVFSSGFRGVSGGGSRTYIKAGSSSAFNFFQKYIFGPGELRPRGAAGD